MIIINLFNLIARISLNSNDFEEGIDDAEKSGKKLTSTFEGIGRGISTMASLAVKAVGSASVAVTGLATLSIKQYAEYEQLVGGVETLFKDSSGLVQEYANNAYKTAGISANNYMNTITSFTASLLQGLGGDTKKAAEIGNQAVIDMSDNANKMGTSMEMIQNAYQGFAKQNYEMLDNLKLGYGGTKEEMQRLLEDASKLSGVEYSIGNFSDIIEAIHVVQTELGITGTTALEASTTIEGSFNSMKSTWQNMLTGIADDNADFDTLINNLVESASTFGDNILPRIEIAIKGIAQLVEQLLPPIMERLPQLITDILPDLLNAGVQLVGSLGNGIIEALPTLIDCGIQAIQTILQGITDNLPQIVSGAMQIMSSLIDGIVQLLPMLLEVGLQLLIALSQGIAENLPTLIPTIVDLVVSMCDTILENLPMLIDVALDIMLALVEGLMNSLPTLIEEVPRIINTFSSTIYDKLPDIIEIGIEIIGALIEGLIEAIPTLIENLPQIIMAIVNVFTLMNWASLGKDLVTNIGSGIKSMFSSIGSTAKELGNTVVEAIKGIFSSGGNIGRNLITAIKNGISGMLSSIVTTAKNIGTSVIEAFKNIFSDTTMSDIGKNLIKGIWSGISNMTGWIIEKIGGFSGSVVKAIKDYFDIHSPSRVMRDEVGVYLAQGVGVGFEQEMEDVNADIQKSLTYDFDTPTTAKTTDKTDIMISLLQQLVKKDASVNIDGRETMRILSQYQDEFDIYNSRNPQYA